MEIRRYKYLDLLIHNCGNRLIKVVHPIFGVMMYNGLIIRHQ